jgi:putative aldouronate transport system permease protein
MGGKPVLFLQDQNLFRWIIIVTEIWKEAGWGTIIYLAAIAGIDAEMYEAAYIDGASRLQRIIHITLPSISSTIIVLLILRMGHVLRNGFEQIFLLYSPMVYQVADVFETYTYRIGISEGRVSFATAVGVFQSLVGLVLILLTNKLAKKYGEGGLW